MIRFPFYGYPRNPFFPGYNYSSNFNIQNKNIEEKNSITNSTEFSNTINDAEQAIFEIFGIKLFLDDLIILGLLFFLYREQVNDQLLYMILLLLLFS